MGNGKLPDIIDSCFDPFPNNAGREEKLSGIKVRDYQIHLVPSPLYIGLGDAAHGSHRMVASQCIKRARITFVQSAC